MRFHDNFKMEFSDRAGNKYVVNNQVLRNLLWLVVMRDKVPLAFVEYRIHDVGPIWYSPYSTNRVRGNVFHEGADLCRSMLSRDSYWSMRKNESPFNLITNKQFDGFWREAMERVMENVSLFVTDKDEFIRLLQHPALNDEQRLTLLNGCGF